MTHLQIVVLCASVTTGCVGPSKEVVERYPSPDGAAEAVVLEINGGATVAYAYSVCVRSKESNSEMIEVALMDRVSSVYERGPKISWDNAQTLVIQFQKAQVYSFKNSAWLRTSPPFRVVGVRLEHPPEGFLP